MMTNLKTLSFSLLFSAAIPCLAQTPKPAPQTSSADRPAVHTSKDDDGQRAFDHNCSRCHTAPQGFSPHISGTIVMHMRARANLSKQDEQAILHFLNP